MIRVFEMEEKHTNNEFWFLQYTLEIGNYLNLNDTKSATIEF